MTMTKERGDSIIDKIGGHEIAVIGDVMLDEYLWGQVDRISPEAPVPVVNIKGESSTPGGAANVAANIIGLGDKPLIVGVVGNDNPASLLDWLLREKGIDTDGLIIDNQRPTTVKTRIVAHNQQVVRADRETKSDISHELEQQIMALLHDRKKNLKGVIISDYGKGMITKNLLEQLITFCLSHEIFIAVDPKDGNFPRYKKVSLITPNHHEAGRAFGKAIEDEATLYEVGNGLMERLDPLSILVTRGEKGMALFQKDKDVHLIPTVAKTVFDVTGAGDTVIASFVSAMAAGASLEEATVISNQAAGVVVGEVGTAVITKDSLLETFNGSFEA
ncbi:MAG: D-glycero-beta-D-manno-heptose-7-phosphate kinase [candidate division Zixibacteria bacterium]|nr:D-glycero-beta-D-manno-heptose-7-phosphate kinase [candidate division Zixibacteria bacterium]